MGKTGADDRNIGERFQTETKYDPDTMDTHYLDWRNMPDPYKSYENPLSLHALPRPEAEGEPDIWTALQRRRSRRDYIFDTHMPQQTLSTLLWATQGATVRYGDIVFRTAPSAGGLFPVETYLEIRNVDGLKPGLYHFRPREFDLEFLRHEDVSDELARAALGQNLVREAQVTFVWSAVIARSRWKYRQRAYRYIYLDAGHIAQNLYLAGEVLGLGVCAIGAFYDDRVNDLFAFDGVEETAIYLATVGYPSPDIM